jgi:hypothetical protein
MASILNHVSRLKHMDEINDFAHVFFAKRFLHSTNQSERPINRSIAKARE